MLALFEYGPDIPVGFAFDVCVRFGGRELAARDLKRDYSNAVRCAVMLDVARPAELPSEVTVILRCSKAVALATPDIFEIWQGELHFDNIPVVEVEPAELRTWYMRGAGARYHGRMIHCDSCGEAERSRRSVHPFAPPAPVKDLRTRLREWLASMQAHAASQPASAPASQP